MSIVNLTAPFMDDHNNSYLQQWLLLNRPGESGESIS